MTVYKRPGVYLNETLTPLAQAATTPGASSAAFVGTCKQGGPLAPTLVSSFSQYVSIYGGFGDTSDLLPFAVYQYFNNGGSGCYVVRAAASDAATATVTLMDTETTPEGTLKVSAISPGTWGNEIFLDVVASAAGAGRFDLVVYVGGTSSAFAKERFTDVSLDPADSRNATALINSPVTGSAYIQIQSLLTTAWDATHAPAVQTGTPLIGGTEGTASVDLVAATERLSVLTDNLVLNLPGVTDSTNLNAVIAWAEAQGNVFVVVDGAKASSSDTEASYTVTLLGQATGAGSLTSSSHVAIYGPWLIVNDPATLANGSARLLPPGGAVLGQYARTDASRGVQKPPAGPDTALRGVLDLQFRFSSTDQDSLNVAGVNVIKSLPGVGFVIYGARTLSAGMPDRYVSIRRSLMMIEKGLVDTTAFAVFEPNDEILWSQVSAVVTQYLMTLLQIGVLSGSTPSQAFFVICDATNNTPTSVQNGQVNVQVGVALLNPAEYIVIEVGQYSGASSTATSTS
jgi:phage tail sheath protein FI